MILPSRWRILMRTSKHDWRGTITSFGRLTRYSMQKTLQVFFSKGSTVLNRFFYHLRWRAGWYQYCHITSLSKELKTIVDTLCGPIHLPSTTDSPQSPARVSLFTCVVNLHRQNTHLFGSMQCHSWQTSMQWEKKWKTEHKTTRQ